jgi:hypothetical protein
MTMSFEIRACSSASIALRSATHSGEYGRSSANSASLKRFGSSVLVRVRFFTGT